jgi:hypothetical protein
MVNQLSDSLRRDCPEVIATHSASKLNKLFHALAKKSDVYDIIQNVF